MESLQLTFTKETDCLKARHFFHLEVRFAGTNIHERFEVEAWTVDIEVGKAVPPEGIVISSHRQLLTAFVHAYRRQCTRRWRQVPACVGMVTLSTSTSCCGTRGFQLNACCSM